MDILRTLLLYFALLHVSSIQSAPLPSEIPSLTTQITPVPIVSATPMPTPAIIPDITTNPAYPTLRFGDKGNDVKRMQERLTELGYYSGEIDAKFGHQSREAVMWFQRNHALSADGIAGKQTLTVLYEFKKVASVQPVIETTPSPTPTPIKIPQVIIPAITPMPTATKIIETVSPTTAVETPATTTVPTPIPYVMYPLTVDPNIVAFEASLPSDTVSLPVIEKDSAYYIPFYDVLEAIQMITILTQTDTGEEYAFALGEDIIRIRISMLAGKENPQLYVYRNGDSIILPDRNVQVIDKKYFLPMQS